MIDFSKYFAYDETSPSCLRWVGVDFHTKENGKFTYAVACLKDQDGKSIQKTFSVKRHGIMVATRLAILKRRELVKSLEEFGTYYSERHGK